MKRNFKASKPNQKWVTDISHIKTKQGTLYLTMIKNLYDNYIVSYNMPTMQDNALVYRTIKRHKNGSLRANSSQRPRVPVCFTQIQTIKRICSGTTLDNAPAKNFFGILKTECVYRQDIQTFAQARKIIDDYIYFYNYERAQTKTQVTPYELRCNSA